jgi:putative peptidoglycan lipid II flippase
VKELKFKSLLNIGSDSRVLAFLILVGSQLGIKVLGLLRDRIQVEFFGASSIERDILVSSYTLSETIYSIASESVMMFAFLPIVSGILKSGNKDAEAKVRNFSSQIITVLAIFLLLLVFVFLVFLDPFLRIIAPNYSDVNFGELRNLSILLLPQAILLSFSTFFSAHLVARGRFKRYAFAPLFYSLSLLIGSMLLEEYGIMALVIATNIGALLHMLVQFTPSFRFIKLRFDTSEVKEFFRLALPLAATAIISRNGLDILNKNLSNQAGDGVLSVFDLAFKIFIIPHSIIALSLSQIFYTDFVGQKIIPAIKRAFNYTLFLTIPITIMFLLLRAQITRIIFGTEGFEWSDTRNVFGALTIMTISMIVFNLILILNRVFYAQKNSKIPILGWMVSNSSFILFGYLLLYTDHLNFLYDIFKIPVFGSPTDISQGIFIAASAYTVSNFTQFAFLYFKMKRDFGFRLSSSWAEIAKISVASLMMTPAVYGTVFMWDRVFGDILTNETLINLVFQTVFAGFIGLLVFLVGSYGLRSTTLQFIIKRFKLDRVLKL